MSEIAATNYVAQSRIDTPLGPLAAVATARGLAGLWFDAQKHHPGLLDAPRDDAHSCLQATARGLAAYWRGDPAPFDEVPLDLHGTAFQRAVWRALLTIGRGRTRTYGEIAAQAGSPAAVRAAGAAIGRNPVSIIVPCHRVIGRDGSLTGYAGGLQRKEALLQFEGVLTLSRHECS
jgi:methylated-DNA-[protein]-cysteine S-methyltransferase